MNKVRQKKLMWVMATLFGAIIAVVLVIYAVGQQTDYYFDPTAISQGKAPEDTRIRAGGMVVRGSVERDSTDPLNVKFKITDFKSTVPVSYKGILPDLFAEGSGVVATGALEGNTFVLFKTKTELFGIKSTISLNILCSILPVFLSNTKRRDVSLFSIGV